MFDKTKDFNCYIEDIFADKSKKEFKYIGRIRPLKSFMRGIGVKDISESNSAFYGYDKNGIKYVFYKSQKTDFLDFMSDFSGVQALSAEGEILGSCGPGSNLNVGLKYFLAY